MPSPGKTRLRFILNPKAGHGLKGSLHTTIREAFPEPDYDVELATTQRAGHATELSRDALEKKFDVVVAVGGDGTINEVAQSLAGSGVPLGILPTGSGNGFARHYRIPGEPRKALSVIRHGHRIRIDSMQVNGRFCLNIAGAGFDAYIAELFSRQRRRGVLTYMKLVIGHYFSYREQRYRIRFDDQEVETPALLVAFANGTQFGNDALIAPKADPADGLMDLVILRKAPWHQVPSILRSLYKGKICEQPYMTCRQVRAGGLEVDGTLTVHVDGEPQHGLSGLEVRLVPGTNWVIIPEH